MYFVYGATNWSTPSSDHIVWSVDRPLLLSVVCRCSIPSIINFFFNVKGWKFPDLLVVRGKKETPGEGHVTKSAKFNEL